MATIHGRPNHTLLCKHVGSQGTNAQTLVDAPIQFITDSPGHLSEGLRPITKSEKGSHGEPEKRGRTDEEISQ